MLWRTGKSTTIFRSSELGGKPRNLPTPCLVSQNLPRGYATLGSPSEALIQDPKFSGSILDEVYNVGEQLAAAALSAELLILRLAGIPYHEWKSYIGRSQFPKFMNRAPARNATTPRYKCEICAYWSVLHELLRRLLYSQGDGSDITDSILSKLDQVEEYFPVSHNLGEDPSSYLAKFADLQNTDTLQELIYSTNQIKHKCVASVVAKCSTQWRDFVKGELAKGGGSLFKFVSRDLKSFLSVSLDDLPGDNGEPDGLLNTEFDAWSGIWGTSKHGDSDSETLAISIRALRDYALQLPEPFVFDQNSLDKALGTYKKTSKGFDNWLPSELVKLPSPAKAAICDSIQLQGILLVPPVQNLLNLHPLLGKPKGRRTIVKTPMLYRGLCRSLGGIDSWDEQSKYEHDSAQKGNSALAAALLRNVAAEAYSVLGFSVGAFFNDYEKFFDHIDFNILLTKCIELRTPLNELCLVTMQHLAPRSIQCAGQCCVVFWLDVNSANI